MLDMAGGKQHHAARSCSACAGCKRLHAAQDVCLKHNLFNHVVGRLALNVNTVVCLLLLPATCEHALTRPCLRSKQSL